METLRKEIIELNKTNIQMKEDLMVKKSKQCQE
jgi:hypothetical protein